jgi:NAD dependent epimerase/dehydratase family enzyme
VPPPALRLLFGEFAGDILGSLRVVPTALLESGFAFAHPDAAAIVRAGLSD